MSSHTIARGGDGIITLTPRAKSSQSAVIILMHGLGDSAEGFLGVAQRLSPKFPHAKFILPTAPTQPVTMNGGRPMPSWYDLGPGKDKGVDESKQRIVNIIQAEVEAGTNRERMALAGFSQGGSLSLYVGMQLPTANGEGALGGIVAMTGRLPNDGAFKLSPGLENTPIWHGHGTADRIIPIAVASKAKSTMMGQGATNYTLVPYEGMGHSLLSSEVLSDVTSFFLSVVPP